MLNREQIGLSTEEFNILVQSPENLDKNLELIYGELVEKMVSHRNSSKLAGKIFGFIFMYLNKHAIGELTPADGGYHVGEHRFIPDVGFVTNEKSAQAKIVEGYLNQAPDLAVEVISPTDKTAVINRKIAAYQEANVLLWVVYPEEQEFHIYAPNYAPTQIFTIKDTLTGGDVLPDFVLTLSDIFGESNEKTDQ